MTTMTHLSIAISPHLFRKSAAATAYLCAPDEQYLASALLHHYDTSVTERFYNTASSEPYVRRYQDILKEIVVGGSGT